MDIVTQGVLGAAVGHAVLGRRLGAKALALGFVGGLAPDLDVLVAGDGESLDYWRYHRGVTHSLFFGPVVGLALAGLSVAVERWRGRAPTTPFWLWHLFWLLVLVTHPLLDAATHWGTQLLAPFDERRFGVSAISIIDPLYTLTLLAGIGLALAKGPRSPAARHVVLTSLVVATLYVGLGWGQNLRAERLARADLAAAGRPVGEVWAFTTIFSPWLRRVVAATDAGHLVGFVSTLRPRPIEWVAVPVEPLAAAALRDIADAPAGRLFLAFANGPVHPRLAAEAQPRNHRELRVYDLRFGFPGATLTGFWGLRAVLDLAGGIVEARRFSVPRTVRAGDLQALLKAKLGLPQPVF